MRLFEFLGKKVEVVTEEFSVEGNLTKVAIPSHGGFGDLLLEDGWRRMLIRGSFIMIVRLVK